MRPVMTSAQLRHAIRMRVADAMAEGFVAGLLVGSLLAYLFA